MGAARRRRIGVGDPKTLRGNDNQHDKQGAPHDQGGAHP
ncbi:hypothetical protein I551_6896 [Mycobacterium ulcerans str. Harvey]|uniref:Uncharacterized protein n=1 Tax=Mycobacterium ulcerans str. Harvey TaxID=1299332 RepID=A0ABP3AB24_MYCUL|nr:hypothetical protein I551_6896 [Mycobacterium ulcerans str. Harvey]